MLVELGSKNHRVDGNGLTVDVKDDDLQDPACSVGTYVEIAVALVEHAESIADRVLNIQIIDAVLTSTVGDLQECKLPCECSFRKLASAVPGIRRSPGVPGADPLDVDRGPGLTAVSSATPTSLSVGGADASSRSRW